MSFLASVKAIGENAVASMKRSVQHLQATPEIIYCPTCAVNVPVPSHVFEWKCQSGHSNARDIKFCSHPECTLPRPSTLPTPTMSCTTCNTRLTIPTNNLTLHLSNAARTTTTMANNAVEVTKQQVAYLRAIPQQFHCNHCDSLLAVPTGPWACQTCTAMNDESILKCRSCQQPKTEQKAICGVCRQSTKIPSSNLLDTLSHTVRDVHKSSQKIYYDLSGKPYVSCPRCNAHIKIVKRSSPASIELEHKEGVPSSSASSSNSPPRPSSASEPGSTNDTSPSHDHIVDVVCPACHNAVDLD